MHFGQGIKRWITVELNNRDANQLLSKRELTYRFSGETTTFGHSHSQNLILSPTMPFGMDWRTSWTPAWTRPLDCRQIGASSQSPSCCVWSSLFFSNRAPGWSPRSARRPSCFCWAWWVWSSCCWCRFTFCESGGAFAKGNWPCWRSSSCCLWIAGIEAFSKSCSSSSCPAALSGFEPNSAASPAVDSQLWNCSYLYFSPVSATGNCFTSYFGLVSCSTWNWSSSDSALSCTETWTRFTKSARAFWRSWLNCNHQVHRPDCSRQPPVSNNHYRPPSPNQTCSECACSTCVSRNCRALEDWHWIPSSRGQGAGSNSFEIESCGAVLPWATCYAGWHLHLCWGNLAAKTWLYSRCHHSIDWLAPVCRWVRTLPSQHYTTHHRYSYWFLRLQPYYSSPHHSHSDLSVARVTRHSVSLLTCSNWYSLHSIHIVVANNCWLYSAAAQGCRPARFAIGSRARFWTALGGSSCVEGFSSSRSLGARKSRLPCGNKCRSLWVLLEARW